MRQDQSHWRGVGRWEDDEAWKNIGNETLLNIEKALKIIGRDRGEITGSTVLEWGPGGGANLFAFRNSAENYIGIDISRKNLLESMRMLNAENSAVVFDAVLLKENIEDAVESFQDKVDFFISTAVFQHFPSKVYGSHVLSAIRKCCKRDAVGVIQIRYDNGFSKYRGITDISEYEQKFVTANSYQIEEFWELLQSNGFKPIAITDIITRVNYATYLISAT
ncbi:hypothetical protein B0E33_04270 [Roseibium algicola]|uniref:Methyltransferase type 11 domain-containing protein n=1 Tax=Roseibium algicola TaxID=2857014 RepID=A0ABN4WTZ8_9HYPH|nr:hypothetical protein B0E33_04270 [Roseibium aggregatum]